jgi:hypothetical protein
MQEVPWDTFFQGGSDFNFLCESITNLHERHAQPIFTP